MVIRLSSLVRRYPGLTNGVRLQGSAGGLRAYQALGLPAGILSITSSASTRSTG